MSGKTWWKHQLYLGSTMRSLEQRAKCPICFAKGFGWRHHLSHTNPKYPLLDGYTTIPIDDTYTNTHKSYIYPLYRKYLKYPFIVYPANFSMFSITHWLVEFLVGPTKVAGHHPHPRCLETYATGDWGLSRDVSAGDRTSDRSGVAGGVHHHHHHPFPYPLMSINIH